MATADPLRSDARRNRARILAAGRELFQDAHDVPMYEVARRAGVGQATLYRHFPDRMELVNALAEMEFAPLVEAARQRAQDPGCLWELLTLMAHTLARVPGLVAVIREDRAGLSPERRQEEIGALFSAPLHSARRGASVRPDLDMDDVFALLMMLDAAIVDSRDEAVRRASADRALALLGEGIRPGQATQPSSAGTSAAEARPAGAARARGARAGSGPG